MKEGWEYKKLGEVCDFQGGSQPPKSEWSKEPRDGYVRMLQIRDFTQNATNYIEYVKKSKSLKYCNDDDILIGRYGASVGKILTGLSGAYNVAIIKTIPQEIVNKHYLKYYFLSPYFQHNLLATSQHRAAQAGFSKEDIFDYKILCPSLSEQLHIVEELDLLSSIIEKKKAQLNELDNMAQSLFYEMFGDPITNDKGWEIKKLGEVCEIVRGGSPRPIDKFLGGNIPWIKIGDATKGDDIYLYSTKEHIIEEGLRKTRYIPKGSLIFANCGVSLGFARIIQFDGCIHDGWLALMNISENKLNKVFLLKSLNFCTTYFRNLAPDGTQPNLNTSIMKLHKQIIPPIIFQDTYVERLGQIEHQKTLIQKSIEQVETLFNSRMDYYFN